MFEVQNLSISYDTKPILQNLSFAVEFGKIIGIVGKNGSGKTTLCLALANLFENGEAKVEGNVLIDGENVFNMSVAEKTKKIGIVFQNPDTQLFSPLVEDELAFAPENLLVEKTEIENRICKILKDCNIENLRNCETQKLSTGQKQMVAFASALTAQPSILILDEAMSNLDKEMKKVAKNQIVQFAKSGGLVLMVTHDKKDLEICDKVFRLERQNYEN